MGPLQARDGGCVGELPCNHLIHRSVIPRAWQGWPLLFGLLFGCMRVGNPCPPGTSLRDDACLANDAALVMGGGEEKDTEVTAAADAGAADADGGEHDVDAGAANVDSGENEVDTGANDMDGGEDDVDADRGIAADADLDAQTDESSASDADSMLALDAGADAEMQVDTSMCAEADLARWEIFHLSTQLTSEPSSCSAADATCGAGSCSIDMCLRWHLGIDSCGECIAQEVACSARACADACGGSMDNQTCRACVCQSGCVAAFVACSGTAAELCADCSAETCTESPQLLPELILMVNHPLL